MTERLVQPAAYVVVTVVLLAMTAANVGLAYLDLGGWNSLVSLAIAAIEVVIMALVFMHLRWSKPVTRLAAVVGLVWLAILMTGTLEDVLTRGWLPVPGK